MSNPSSDVAFFIPQMRGGGAERVIYSLANKFSENGYSVDLLLARKKGEFLERIGSDVNIIELWPSKTTFTVPNLVYYLQQNQPDAFMSSAGANMPTSITRRLYQGNTEIYLNIVSPTSSSSTGHVYDYAVGNLFPNTSKLIAVSEYVKEDLVYSYGLSKSKIEVIHNPIDLREIENMAKKECGLESEMTTIVTAGRLTPVKDHITLINAFRDVLEVIDARLVILGEGKERKKIEKRIEDLDLTDKVELPGFVDNPYKYMSRSDVFVLSSKYEGLGNVLIEAMACGTPIVSTDCPGGPSEILSDGDFGPLVPVGDSEALSQAIIESISNPVGSSSLKERASDFSTNAIYKEFEQLFFGGKHEND